MIDSRPQTACLPIDPDEHLIKMPAPQRIRSTMNTALPDFSGKQRAKTVPPVPYGFMVDVDAAFEQKIFDLSQRQGVGIASQIKTRRSALDPAQ